MVYCYVDMMISVGVLVCNKSNETSIKLMKFFIKFDTIKYG